MGGPRGQWQVNEPRESIPAICTTRLLLGEEVVKHQLCAQKERATQRGEQGRAGGDVGGARARAVRPRSGTGASLTGLWAAWERVQDACRMLREGGTVHMVSAISIM